MKSEIWELTHRVYGVEFSFADLLVLAINLMLLATALCCWLLSLCKKQDRIRGVYYAYPFTSLGESLSFKAYRIGRNRHSAKKRGNY